MAHALAKLFSSDDKQENCLSIIQLYPVPYFMIPTFLLRDLHPAVHVRPFHICFSVILLACTIAQSVSDYILVSFIAIVNSLPVLKFCFTQTRTSIKGYTGRFNSQGRQGRRRWVCSVVALMFCFLVVCVPCHVDRSSHLRSQMRI